MTLVQIYEIQTIAEAEQMIALGVDHIGSVLQADRPWKDSAVLETIRCVQRGGAKSSLIPLFTEVYRIAQVIDYYKPDIVHFCDLPGNDQQALAEAVQRQRDIRDRFASIEIMRSIPIPPAGRAGCYPSLQIAAAFVPYSDWFLTDTLIVPENFQSLRKQPVDGFVGITGQTCDWSVARRLVEASKVPVILAGGIGPENAAAGMAQVQPAGVDSCTRTNGVDDLGRPVRFRKDPCKVAALVKAVRGDGAGGG